MCKVVTCKIETKKRNAGQFVSYLSAFITVLIVVCTIASFMTIFDFAGHFWRSGLFVSIIVMFIFSQIYQWELYPTLKVDENGRVIYKYNESVSALGGSNEISYEFVRVDGIKYCSDCVKLYGLFKYKAPLRKTKEVKKCKISITNSEVESFLTEHVKVER